MSIAGSKSLVFIWANGGTPQGVSHFAKSGFICAGARDFGFAARTAEPLVKVKAALLPAKKSLRFIVYTSLTKQKTISLIGGIDEPYRR
jgi:hypothetical protein